MMKETDIFNDTSLQNDIQDLVAIEQGILRARHPLPDLDEELEKIMGKEASAPTISAPKEKADDKKPAQHRPLLRSIVSAALGAAAMWAAILVWNWAQAPETQDGGMAAMNTISADGMATIQTTNGEMITLTLADGTEVKLNSNSKLTYPHQFRGKERIIHLSGEAFFKVKHDSNRPFIVDAGGILTKDLGTSFNIKAYSCQDCKVTLVEGKVAVLTKEQDAKPVILSPGQQFSMIPDAPAKIKSVDTEETTAWADGVLYYHDQTLEHIIADLSAHYHLTTDFRNQQAKDKHLDLSIDKKGSAADAITLLNDLGVAKISLKGKKILVE